MPAAVPPAVVAAVVVAAVLALNTARPRSSGRDASRPAHRPDKQETNEGKGTIDRHCRLRQGYAAQTAEDPNPKYRHASAWLSALVAKETLSAEEMTPFYEKLVEYDPDINSIEDAKVEVRLAERDLKSLRKQLNAR